MGVSGSPAANVPVSNLPVSSYLFIIPTSAFPLKGKVHLQIAIRKGLFGFFQYFFQHCFICSPSDFTVPEDAGIEPLTALPLVHKTTYSIVIAHKTTYINNICP
jgi:hypothetical protein